jgi:hypothetical protein
MHVVGAAMSVVEADAQSIERSYEDDSSEMWDADDSLPLLDSTQHHVGLCKRTQRRLPKQAQHILGSIKRWIRGPRPSRIYHIDPILSNVQHAPLDLLARHLPQKASHIKLLLGFYFLWAFVFVAVSRKSTLSDDIPGYGPPTRLSCDTSLWINEDECGIDGYRCRPFTNTSVPFRCPANCAPEKLWNPRIVGQQSINLQPLVIGGATDLAQPIASSRYRGDSWICAAAIHAGYVDDRYGGCGLLRLTGEQTDYPSVKSHGIESVGFDSYFPQSFTFEASAATQCRDLRVSLSIINFLFTVILSLFVTDPAIFFFSVFIGLFFQTALVSDPPDLTDYASLFSLALKHLLPTSFCAVILFQTSVRRSLTGLTAQIEKTILWLIPAWIGALNNYTFDQWIPIQRLTPHDLRAQAGAITALLIIIFVILSIALGQAWAFRVEGRMPRYLAIYGAMVVSLLLLVAVPGMHLRLHHYILALLLLPGTSFQNRPSLVYQGLLIGLFINGTARWGFASILETDEFLLRGGLLNTAVPSIHAPIIDKNSISFELGSMPGPDRKGRSYYGISALVNDVERLEEFSDHALNARAEAGSHWDKGLLQWTWTRPHEDAPYYFRFAYMTGRHAGDYTAAGVWLSNGTWVDIPRNSKQMNAVD